MALAESDLKLKCLQSCDFVPEDAICCFLVHNCFVYLCHSLKLFLKLKLLHMIVDVVI